MAELALISTLIHLRVQKAMCVNDCRSTFQNMYTHKQRECSLAHTYTNKMLTHPAWEHVWTHCLKCLNVPC